MRGAACALLMAMAPAASWAEGFDCRFSVGCLEGSRCGYQLLRVAVRAQEGRTTIELPDARFAVAETLDEATGVRSFVSGIERAPLGGAERGTVHLLTIFADGEARLTSHGLGRFVGASIEGDAFARTDFGQCEAR